MVMGGAMIIVGQNRTRDAAPPCESIGVFGGDCFEMDPTMRSSALGVRPCALSNTTTPLPNDELP
jgi:hypothetical protein